MGVKILLYNPETEKIVIGCIIIEPELFKKAIHIIKPKMFLDEKIQDVFSAMIELEKSGKPVDMVTLSSFPQLKADARETLNVCKAYCTSTKNFEEYCNVIFESWIQRRLNNRLQELTMGEESSQNIIDRLRKIVRRYDELSANKLDSEGKDIMDAVTDTWVNLFKSDTSIKTNWPYFDKVFGGFQRGGLYVLAARPGDGKSDFSLALSLQISKIYCVIFLSLEMSIEQLTQRILSRLCKINSSKFRDKTVSEEEQKYIVDVSNRIKGLKLRMYDNPSVTLEDIENKLSTLNPDMLVIDYLSLIKMDTGKNKPQWQAIGEITHTLKVLAKKYNCVIFLLAQLNRVVDKQKGNSLSDLRGSGDIEADADGVMFLCPQKTDTFLFGNDFWRVDLIVRKNRHGGMGKIEFNWWPQYHDYSIVTNIYDEKK